MGEPFREILESCMQFASREIAPGSLEADLKPDHHWLDSLWEKGRELGLPGLPFPEETGGAGLPASCGALVLETFASACAGYASVLACHLAAVEAVLRIAEAQGRPPLALLGAGPEGPPPATLVFPPAGEDNPLSLRVDDRGFILEGTSSLTGNAGFAGLFVVFAAEAGSKEGVACLALERGCPGFSLGASAELPGLRVNRFARATFDGVRPGRQSLLLEGRPGLAGMEMALGLWHGFIAATCLGLARAAYEQAAAYARQRYQFGRMIIGHQEIQRLLGRMLKQLQVATAACLSLFDERQPLLAVKDGSPALVKSFCADAALAITVDAIQIHGGYGYMHEYGLEKRMRDAKVLQLLGGSSPCLEVEAIARTL